MQNGDGQHGLMELQSRMIASSHDSGYRNETTWMVSFFFVIACHYLTGDAFGWQTNNDDWIKPSAMFRDRIERASREQWLGLINLSAKAILGETVTEDIGQMPPEDLPGSERSQWLSERIDRWTTTQSFIEEQSRAWIADRCGGSLGARNAWDFRLHDDWVRNAIARNESFLRFLQCQIEGDLLSDDPEARLGTAAWFRGSAPENLELRGMRSPEDRRPFLMRTSPTLDQLPENLRWTFLSRLPWLACDVSDSQRARLMDLESSMLSVLRSEQRDWRRLQNEEAVARWHRTQSNWPIPNPADQIFILSHATKDNREDAASEPYASFIMASPLRSTQPWTLILEFEVFETGAIPDSDPIVMVLQRDSRNATTAKSQNLEIAWDQGKLSARWIHSLPYSYLSIETEPILRQPGNHTVAVVYEGLPSVNAFRVWADGQWLESRALHDVMVRDLKSSDMQALDVASQSASHKLRVTQLESYRSALSSMELEGWRQEKDWKEWEACSESEQRAAREHYARRVDPQWRYQRESLSFYAESFESVLSQVGMVPLCESQLSLQIPHPLAEAMDGEIDSNGWNAANRKKLGLDCEGRLSSIVSSREVLRQWRGMLASLDLNSLEHDTNEMSLLARVSKPWSQSWNRRDLIRAILLSDAWLVTAIDSLP